MPTTRHILIVNSRNVHQPVFVVGASHSGTDIIGRALKASGGFHVTIGQRSVLRVVYAFARRPSMYHGRTAAAAAVIRDAFAQGWQVSASSCLDCAADCRAAAGLDANGVGPCVEQRGLERYGDASPDLIFCAEALTAAFPDARIVQVIRDGRDVVASMLADPLIMSWYRPSFVNLDTEFPNPFFGVETEAERDSWPDLSPAARCALRWRWSVRLAARLHHGLPAGQIKTVRYEELIGHHEDVIAEISRFTEMKVAVPRLLAAPGRGGKGLWPGRNRSAAQTGAGTSTGTGTDGQSVTGTNANPPALSAEQHQAVEQVAGEELRRLGYPRRLPRRPSRLAAPAPGYLSANLPSVSSIQRRLTSLP